MRRIIRKKDPLPDTEMVEVVVRKQMSYREYLKIVASIRDKGWEAKAYQLNFFSPPMNAEK